MHLATFLQDLAAIMIVAGITTVIFHQLRQPVVLGYIIAGVILGPHALSFPLIQDEATVKGLAELGVVFLMFSLGLEFSIRKLLRVGVAAFIAATAEIVFMIFIGYEIGQFFGWSAIDSLFLGAMLAISSTTIIIKALDELGIKKESFAQLIFGILIIEDILAIGMLVLLSGIADSGSINTVDVAATLGKLLIFLVVALVIGILTVPKIIRYVARFNSNEMLLVTTLGFCFGFCLLVAQLDYSIALGAFLIGAIIAESREIKHIEKLVEPLTSMFSAIFFVSIGLLVDPKIIAEYIVPITMITVAVVFGKIITCTLGAFLAGQNGKTSMRVGMGLAQIGEFSFIIASLGVTLKVTSDFLYPIIVAVSAITTLLTPYLMKIADPLSTYIARKMPRNISEVFTMYTTWLQNIRPEGDQAILVQSIKRGFLQIFINLMLIVAIFFAGSYISHNIHPHFSLKVSENVCDALIWGGTLILSLPFLIAIYRKIKALSIKVAELTVKQDKAGIYNAPLRRAISGMIPMISMLGILFLLAALSASILPSIEVLVLVVVIVVMVTAILWRWFFKLHSRLRIAFIESMIINEKNK